MFIPYKYIYIYSIKYTILHTVSLHIYVDISLAFCHKTDCRNHLWMLYTHMYGEREYIA